MIRTGLIVSAAAVAVMAGAWIWMNQNLPADAVLLPVHWGVTGQPDRFLPRDEALRTHALIPALGVALAALFAIIPFIDPRKDNIRRGGRA